MIPHNLVVSMPFGRHFLPEYFSPMRGVLSARRVENVTFGNRPENVTTNTTVPCYTLLQADPISVAVRRNAAILVKYVRTHCSVHLKGAMTWKTMLN